MISLDKGKGIKLNQHEIDIYNDGMALGWKLAWERIREILNPVYRNTREKLPNYKLKTKNETLR